MSKVWICCGARWAKSLKSCPRCGGENSSKGEVVSLTKWELGNDMRFICDKIFDLEKECNDEMSVTRDVLKTCRLAMGHLSNKLCNDNVLLPENKGAALEIIKLSKVADFAR